MIPGRWVSVAFTLWITVITFRYGSTVVGSLRSPFNLGSDIEWFAIWLVAALLMILLAATIKRAVEIVFAILAAAGALILILSGTLVSAIIVLGLLWIAHVWGKRILGYLGVESGFVAITIPLGLIVPALAGFLLAAVHLLTPTAIWMLVAFLLIVPLLEATRVFRYLSSLNGRSELSRTSETRMPLLLFAPAVLINLTWAVAPEIQFDADTYHLAVSQIYLRNAGFVDLPYFVHSYFYRLVDMLFTIALALHGPASAKLLSFAFSLIAAVAVFSLGRLVFDERVGIWAAAFFYTTPIVSWLAGTAYIDAAVVMFLTATIIAFLQWHHRKEQAGWLYASAILAGATVAAKLNGAFTMPVMLAVAVWHLRSYPRTLAVCALLTLFIVLPWYATTYLWTGNPVFPLLNGVFKSPLLPAESRVMNALYYGIGTSPPALLRLPFRLTFETTRFGESSPRGAAGIALLFALPFGLALLSVRDMARTFLLVIALGYFLVWALTFQYVRYYVQILPVVCVLGAAAVFHIDDQRRSGINRICLATALVLQFSTTPIQFWNIDERFPVAVALGRETREAFLTRALDVYAGAKSLNAMINPGERVAGVDVEDSRFYLDAPLETLPDATQNSALKVAASTAGEHLFQALRQSGFSYIFARRGAVKDPPGWCPYVKPEFLKKFTTLVFSDGKTVVYRLNN